MVCFLSKNFADVLFVFFHVETKYNIENLAIGNSASKGFYLQVKHTPNRPPLKLPSIFFDVSVTKNSISFTTNDVLMLNARAKQAIEEIYLQSDCIITKLINDIRTKISCLYTLTDIVAHVDLAFSFAYTQCSCSNYIRPQFNRYTEIINVSRLLQLVNRLHPSNHFIYSLHCRAFILSWRICCSQCQIVFT